MRRLKALQVGVVWLLLALLLGGCSSVRFYGQAVRGQSALLVHQRSIKAVLRDPDTDPALAARLRLTQEARRFASTALGLPDNTSYTRYVDLHRPYVVWNVFVAPAYALDPVPQCFPIAGCVAYRGWFSAKAARADATRWRTRGDDVWVGGVSAYSTLGWFADPLLSSMVRQGNDALIGMLFHELAHQAVYVKGDTTFNESFATFVQQEGLRQWHRAHGLPTPDPEATALETGFTHLVLDLRARLRTLYASGVPTAVMAGDKQRQIEAFRHRYAAWRDARPTPDHRYDAWVAAPINNAALLPFGLYATWTQAFAAMFVHAGCVWPRFLRQVGGLARKPQAQRDEALRRWLPVRRADVAQRPVEPATVACRPAEPLGVTR